MSNFKIKDLSLNEDISTQRMQQIAGGLSSETKASAEVCWSLAKIATGLGCENTAAALSDKAIDILLTGK
jgi:hypothetical protein